MRTVGPAPRRTDPPSRSSVDEDAVRELRHRRERARRGGLGGLRTGFFEVLLGLALAGAASACTREPLPELFPVASFELTDQDGQPFGSDALRGEVWIADFFFTTCPTICETLTERMGALRAWLEAEGVDALLVSFTVDPETDRPEVLEAYARRHDADVPRWRFLTGEPEDVRSVVVGSFKLPMQVQAEDPDAALMRIAHGVRFVLVDRQHTIRGLYETTPEALGALVEDAARL